MSKPLPPLRRKILRSYLWIAAIYALALSAPLAVGLFIDSGPVEMAPGSHGSSRSPHDSPTATMSLLRYDEHRLGNATVLAFTMLLALALLMAFAIAWRQAADLSEPLVQIADGLGKSADLELALALPPADSAEMDVLRKQLLLWWDQSRTAQRLNLAEIVAQRDRLEALLSSMEDAVLLLDVDGRVAQVNGRFAALLASDPASATGELWADLAAFSDNGRRLLAVQGQDEALLDLGLGDKRRIFALRRRHLADLGTLHLLQDVTERRQRERLEDEFLAVLSHELKTPLQSLGTAADLLDAKRALLDPSLYPIVDIIQEDLGRIRGLANEFVQVSQLNVRAIRLKVDGLPLDERLTAWARPFELLAAEKDARLELDLSGVRGVRVQADPVKFSWVVSNLLSNAVRVSPAGGVIVLSAREKDGHAAIIVQDQGPGVPPELQARLFEPFFQADPRPGSKTSGLLGLGLTVAKEIVEAHGGSIEYRLPQGGGSVFTVHLPQAQALSDLSEDA